MNKKHLKIIIIMLLIVLSVGLTTACASKFTGNNIAQKSENDYRYVIEVNGKYGLINKQGKEVVKPQYDESSLPSKGLVPIFNKIQTENKSQYEPFNIADCTYVDESTNTKLIPEKIGYPPVKDIEGACPSFSDGLLMVYYNKNYNIGFINKKGVLKVKTSLKWDNGDIPPIMDFSDGLTAFSTDNKWGFIDKTGKIVIKNQFNIGVGSSFWITDNLNFHEGLAKACIEYTDSVKCGYINKQGSYVWSFDINNHLKGEN